MATPEALNGFAATGETQSTTSSAIWTLTRSLGAENHCRTGARVFGGLL